MTAAVKPSDVFGRRHSSARTSNRVLLPHSFSGEVTANRGVLKNAIDWASRPYGDSTWNGKPVAIMGASIGTIGTARAQYHLRQVFVFLNMFPINQPEVMIGNAAERFDAEGNLMDETAKKLIRQLLQSLVQWTGQFAQSHE